MKRLSILFAFLLMVVTVSFAQDSKLPNVTLKDLDGNSINLSELSNDGKPIVISFWATWCSPCKRELNAIHEVYEDWVAETGVKVYAISIDDQRNVSKVKPTADANAWDFTILLDTNSDLKRAMGVNSVPFTFLIDGEGNIVWRHNNYNPGDENELYEKIVELAAE